MSENTSETAPALVDAPEDVKASESKGYAVYDRTIGQFVGSVSKGKPSDTDAAALAPGHTVAVVRV